MKRTLLFVLAFMAVGQMGLRAQDPMELNETFILFRKPFSHTQVQSSSCVTQAWLDFGRP